MSIRFKSEAKTGHLKEGQDVYVRGAYGRHEFLACKVGKVTPTGFVDVPRVNGYTARVRAGRVRGQDHRAGWTHAEAVPLVP